MELNYFWLWDLKNYVSVVLILQVFYMNLSRSRIFSAHSHSFHRFQSLILQKVKTKKLFSMQCRCLQFGKFSNVNISKFSNTIDWTQNWSTLCEKQELSIMLRWSLNSTEIQIKYNIMYNLQRDFCRHFWASIPVAFRV